jgi:DNA polymerase-3 subunit alpha
MVGASAAVHDARDSGQLSIFDLMMGGGNGRQAHVSPIRLPDVEEVKGREKLQWEKELLGVYSISHPLQQMNIDFKRVTTCSCAELDERHDGKGVTLAGVITNVRTINTKKGDQMAFVQIEDLQGGCEVVFFPKAYADYKEKLTVDSVVMVKGKAQTREGQTSLLADILQTHVESYVGIDETPSLQTPLFANGAAANGAHGSNAHGNGTVVNGANGMVMNDAAAPYDVNDSGDMMFTGEISPFQDDIPDWAQDSSQPPGPDALVADSLHRAAENAGEEEVTKEVTKAEISEAEMLVAESKADAVGVSHAAPPAPAILEPAAVAGARPIVEGDGAQGRHKLATVAASPTDAAGPTATAPRADQPDPRPLRLARRQLLIIFRRSGNLERDKFRLKEIYDAVCDPRGRDAFVIRLTGAGNAAELTFPNDGCTINDRLTTELQKHFRVEIEVLE